MRPLGVLLIAVGLVLGLVGALSVAFPQGSRATGVLLALGGLGIASLGARVLARRVRPAPPPREEDARADPHASDVKTDQDDIS